MSFVDTSAIRIAGGFPSDLISDADINHSIEIVQEYAERTMNTHFAPQLRIESHNGTNTEFIYTDKNPVLRIDNLKTGEITLDSDNFYIERECGKLILKNTSSVGRFFSGSNNVKIAYWTAFLIQDKVFTNTSADIEKGSAVSINVDSAVGLSVNDWVELTDLDGNYCSARITNINSNTLTLDKVTIDFETGAFVRKLRLPNYIKRLIELECVIYLALNAIGATYVFNASYSLGDLQVTKGVPYTHWRESLEKAIKERTTLLNTIKPRFKIM